MNKNIQKHSNETSSLLVNISTTAKREETQRTFGILVAIYGAVLLLMLATPQNISKNPAYNRIVVVK